MGNARNIAEAFEEVLQSGDFARIQQLIREYATDDFVTDWPQSGERLSKQAAIDLLAKYPEMTGTSPAFTYSRMAGGGDVFVVEGTVDYGDGVPVRYVGIGELRDGKVAKMTEYFANPFEAPAWRADFVERTTPVTA
jgi:SnoaL-like domain